MIYMIYKLFEGLCTMLIAVKLDTKTKEETSGQDNQNTVEY